MPNPQAGTAKCQGGGGTGQRFTYAQLEGLWIKAGGPRDKAPIMAAIAMAESGGCSAALNSLGACGLWQIHPRQAGCLDPATNARQAVAKYQGQGLDAWTTYTTGAYKGFLSSGTTPDLNVPGKGTTQDTPEGETTATCLVGLPQFSAGPLHVGGGCAISKSEGRAFLGGTLILGGGLVMALGVLLLAAYGLKSSGAAKHAGGALEAVGAATALVPGAELAGAGIIAAGSRAKQAGQAGAEQRARARAARRASSPPPKGAQQQQKQPAGP